MRRRYKTKDRISISVERFVCWEILRFVLTRWGCRFSSSKVLLVKTFSFTRFTAGLEGEKKWHAKVNFEKDLSPFTQAKRRCIYLRTSGISGLFLKRDDVLINGLPWSPCSSGAFFGNVFTFDGDFAAVISLWSPFSSVSLLLHREGLLGVCSFCLCVCCWPVWLIFLCLEALLSWGSKTAFLFDSCFFCNINTDSTALHNQAVKKRVCFFSETVLSELVKMKTRCRTDSPVPISLLMSDDFDLSFCETLRDLRICWALACPQPCQ